MPSRFGGFGGFGDRRSLRTKGRLRKRPAPRARAKVKEDACHVNHVRHASTANPRAVLLDHTYCVPDARAVVAARDKVLQELEVRRLKIRNLQKSVFKKKRKIEQLHAVRKKLRGVLTGFHTDTGHVRSSSGWLATAKIPNSRCPRVM